MHIIVFLQNDTLQFIKAPNVDIYNDFVHKLFKEMWLNMHVY